MSYWFRPKRYGWGASPANWKGWLAIALFVILATAVRLAMAGQPQLMQLGALVVLLVLFARIVWKKTDGTWRWRWGPDAKEK